MHNTHDLFIQYANNEIVSKTFGFTEQLLKIHQIEQRNGKPKIARVDTDKPDGTAIVYYHIVDQTFYLAIYIDTIPEPMVRAVTTEPYHSVYLRADSETLSLSELGKLSVLPATGGRNIGEKKSKTSETATWKASTIFFEPNTEADEFEDKLEKLLSFLEGDKAGVNRLVIEAGAYVQVFSSFHNGNTMLGGHHINKDLLKRMAKLNLAIDFDISVEGISYT
ncbi:MAG: DUF4279 domain-containing protein [Chitinophagaceae bacterium]|nr:MAG: DUF4279 domain-containing protein [Chitinophagaceae bacterium]